MRPKPTIAAKRLTTADFRPLSRSCMAGRKHQGESRGKRIVALYLHAARFPMGPMDGATDRPDSRRSIASCLNRLWPGHIIDVAISLPPKNRDTPLCSSPAEGTTNAPGASPCFLRPTRNRRMSSKTSWVCRFCLAVAVVCFAGVLRSARVRAAQTAACVCRSRTVDRAVARHRRIAIHRRSGEAGGGQGGSAVVAVKVGQAQGSGVVVSKDGIVLTAGHLTVKPKEKADLTFPDGKTVHGVTLGVDRDADAGMVRITDKGQWPCVEMAPAGSVRPGMWCVALGHPLGYQAERPPVIRLGRVLHVSANTLHTDCTLVAGDSGGPVFDLDGRLIGINSRISMNVTSLNFHVPVNIYASSGTRCCGAKSYRRRWRAKQHRGRGPFPARGDGGGPLRGPNPLRRTGCRPGPSSAPMAGCSPRPARCTGRSSVAPATGRSGRPAGSASVRLLTWPC